MKVTPQGPFSDKNLFLTTPEQQSKCKNCPLPHSPVSTYKWKTGLSYQWAPHLRSVPNKSVTVELPLFSVFLSFTSFLTETMLMVCTYLISYSLQSYIMPTIFILREKAANIYWLTRINSVPENVYVVLWQEFKILHLSMQMSNR